MIPAALLLVFFPWGNDLWVLPKMTAACAGAAWWAWRSPTLVRPTQRGPWIFVAAALLASTFFSWDLGYSLFGVPNPMGLGLFQWAVCALLVVVGMNTDVEEVDRTVTACALVMVGYAICQGLGLEFPFLSPKVLTGNRHGSTQGSPVFLGFALAVVAPTVWARRRWLGAALLIGAALAAKSRAALIAVPAVIAYLYWRDRGMD